MRINPNTLDLCRGLLRESDILFGTEQALLRECLVVERDDYKKAVDLLKKYKKSKSVDWWNDRFERFDQEQRMHFNAYDFLWQLKQELEYRERYNGRRGEVDGDLDAVFEWKKVDSVRSMILTYVKFKKTEKRILYYNSFENLDQYLTT